MKSILLRPLLAGMLLSSCLSFPVKEPKLGVYSGSLDPCPSKPNCVGSLEDPDDSTHFTKAVEVKQNRSQCLRLMSRDLTSQAHVELHTISSSYLRLVYQSSIFRFKDDLELYIDPSHEGIQIRSASRVGYSDMGVNKKRASSIRKLAKSLCK